MPAPIKSTVRIQLEREIAEALRAEQRALTAREIYDRIHSVETRDQLSSLLNHMKRKGDLLPGAPRMPDEPGGIKGRETITYLWAADEQTPDAEPDGPACAEMVAMAAGAMPQGKSADIVALAKMTSAEEDDGEACITQDPTAAAYCRAQSHLIHDPEGNWDRAENTINGDELHNAAPSVAPWLDKGAAQVLDAPWTAEVAKRVRRASECQEPPTLATDPVIAAIIRMEEPRWQEGQMHADRLRALAESAVCAAHPDVRAWLYDLSETIEDMAA